MDMFLFGKYNIIWIGVPSQWWVKNINLWLWVPSELSAAEAWSGQIKQSWRGNDSAPNQIYVRSPQREIDVLSDVEDFNSLCYNTDKQSAFCLESISLIVWVCVCVSQCLFCLGFSLLCVLRALGLGDVKHFFIFLSFHVVQYRFTYFESNWLQWLFGWNNVECKSKNTVNI